MRPDAKAQTHSCADLQERVRTLGSAEFYMSGRSMMTRFFATASYCGTGRAVPAVIRSADGGACKVGYSCVDNTGRNAHMVAAPRTCEEGHSTMVRMGVEGQHVAHRTHVCVNGVYKLMSDM
jgi:hypothetical protein